MQSLVGSSPGALDRLAAQAGRLRGEITIDQARRVMIVKQWQTEFDMEPQVVVISFDSVKVLAGQAILLDAGMMKAGPVEGGTGPALVP